VSAVLGFDLVKDLADRTPFGEMAQFDRQVLLERLVVVLGLALQRSVDVVRDVTDQNVRHAYIMLARADRSKKREFAVAGPLPDTGARSISSRACQGQHRTT
jgi:hypothetical protein